MKIRVVLISAFILFLSGCVGIPDSEGWHFLQKNEFMKILQDDTYLSLCDQKTLYKEVKESKNTRLMSKLLVAYTENLANGCIDLSSFEQAQNTRKSDTFKTHFEIYRQKVDPASIKRQLQAGVSIKQILKPFVPTYREWNRLIQRYRQLSGYPKTDPMLLHKLRLNIERIKLMKPENSKSYALINIPEFKVRIIENGLTVISMRVVVGKQHMQTPIFGEDLKYIVVNPQWNVPDSIARHEIIPKILKNPSYLKKHRLVIKCDYNLDSPTLKLCNLNPKAYLQGKKPIPFKFIEPPSQHNGLGRVKFLFPNQHSVYMHDTQAKYLFKRNLRMFSHGCIRLEHPHTLMRYLVTHYTNTPWEEAKKMYESFKTHSIMLTKRLSVHTTYLTTYIDDNRKLQIFKDVYGYDKLQRLKF